MGEERTGVLLWTGFNRLVPNGQHRDFSVFVVPQGSPSPGLPENADKIFVQGIVCVVVLLLEHQGLDCQKGKI